MSELIREALRNYIEEREWLRTIRYERLKAREEEQGEHKMKEHKDPIPVVLYARVSRDRQDVDLLATAQVRALRDYVGRNGYVAAREYVDGTGGPNK